MMSREFCCCESKIFFVNSKFTFEHHIARTLMLEKWRFLKSDTIMTIDGCLNLRWIRSCAILARALEVLVLLFVYLGY
jgi:hypothetical protein